MQFTQAGQQYKITGNKKILFVCFQRDMIILTKFTTILQFSIFLFNVQHDVLVMLGIN